MPKRILIIGLLFLLAGASAIWDIIASAVRRRVNINFTAFLLPVGIGLLRGKRRSQWWARFWIILGYILCAMLIAFAVEKPELLTARVWGRNLPAGEAFSYAIGAATILAALLFLCHVLLYSRKACDYFNRRPQ